MDFKIKSIFISKSKNELVLLPDFCEENNLELTTHSFLTFEGIDFNIEKSFDVVFFASPRAVNFFLKKFNLTNELIAVAGESTKKHVEDLGYKVGFYSKNSGDIQNSSMEFANWIQEKNVLFPTSTISKKSYTQYLRKDQHTIESIYKTHISTEKIGKFNLYVFTSPSNVIGFFNSNIIEQTSKIIAWGETTLKELEKHIDSKNILTLTDSSEKALIEQIKKAIIK